MTSTLRVVEVAADPGPDERVRLVVRMLLGWHQMTEIELGRRLDLKRTPIYDRMQGRKPFTVAEVVRMGEIFRVDPAAFLAGPAALIPQTTRAGDRYSAQVTTPQKSPSTPERTRRPALALVA